MTDRPTDDKVLERAKEIQEKQPGMTLTAAMMKAEEELAPAPEIQTKFTFEVTLQPRVAKWLVDAFPANDHYTVEERVSAWIAGALARLRVDHKDTAAGEIPDGSGAKTMRGDKYGEALAD